MAGLPPPLSAAEEQQLSMLLARKQAASESNAGYSGAMTDASKRLREETFAEESDGTVSSFQFVPCASFTEPGPSFRKNVQAPIVSTPKNGITLPPGVDSLEDWGTAIMETPKYKGKDLSYEELVADSSHSSYLKWTLDHGKEHGGRCVDFRNYLIAIGYNPEKTVTDPSK